MNALDKLHEAQAQQQVETKKHSAALPLAVLDIKTEVEVSVCVSVCVGVRMFGGDNFVFLVVVVVVVVLFPVSHLSSLYWLSLFSCFVSHVAFFVLSCLFCFMS